MEDLGIQLSVGRILDYSSDASSAAIRWSKPRLVLDGSPPIEQHLGALLVYCGGCALALGDDRLEAVSKRLHRSLRDQPFLGLLTYGEHCVDDFGGARFAGYADGQKRGS